MRPLLASLLGLFVSGCAAPVAPPVLANPELAATWRPEVIELPPEFAPGLPAGTEELRFAPGMFEEGAEDYWSYVFVLRLDEPLVGEAAVRELLEQYYVGLIGAVSASRGREVAEPLSRLELSPVADGQFVAELDLVDAFVTGEPLTLLMELALEPLGAGTRVRVAASPQERGHAVWASLRGVLAALE